MTPHNQHAGLMGAWRKAQPEENTKGLNETLSTEKPHKAAFYDLDGTLLSCNLVTTYAYYARNDRSIFKSAYLLTKVALSVPLLFGLDLYSRSLFNVFFFRAYRGMHRDRLVGLRGRPVRGDAETVHLSQGRRFGPANSGGRAIATFW